MPMLSSVPAGRTTQLSPEQSSLAKAFASFTEAAGSLERSYEQLHQEVVRLRRELQAANTELAEQRETARRLEVLAEVSTVLAHEIRNPLGTLELFAGLLAESGLDEQQAGWVRHMQGGLRTVAATVNNVLQLHHRAAPTFTLLDVATLLEECVDFLRPLADQANIELVLQASSSSQLIPADRHCLMQLFLNLALNAFRAMPEGGRFRISVQPPSIPGMLEIKVSDTGCGISDEHLARIFEAGFTTRPGGVGLGLAVCRKIVAQHGGRMAVESTAGAGTTFSVCLPRTGGV